jgi:hypothetical protein
MAAAGAPKRPSSAVYCEVDGLRVDLELRELNTAGLFVLTPMPLPEGSEVEVFVRLGDTRVSTTGSVVQSVSCELATAQGRKPGYGLLFTSLDDTGRAELRRGIDSLRVSRPPLDERALRRSAPADARAAERPSQGAQRRSAPNPAPPVKPSSPAAARRTGANSVIAQEVDGRRSSPEPVAPRKPPSPAARRTGPNPVTAEPAPSVKPPSPAARRTGAKPVQTEPDAQPAPLVFVPTGTPRAGVLSAAPTSPWWNEDELKLLDELRAELAAVQTKTPWAILGVSQGADAAEAKAAFHRASKRYHPHLYARYAHPAIQQVVTELFIAHKRAFTTLTKSGRGARPR